MEYRIVSVGGWEFQIQVLPFLSLLASRTVGEDEKRLGSTLALTLALEILKD